MSDNVTPIRPTIGLSRMGQLRRFVAWEREHNPGKTHIAEWALAEIEALQGLLDEVRCCFTRDDDLPGNLLPRIDAALRNHDRAEGHG